jgi:hypothetical protein
MKGWLSHDGQGPIMTAYRNREEVINTQLALLLSKLGVTADAETIHVHGKHRPDVLFQMRGLRVAIEGKFADHPSAADVVLDDARKRVRSGIAHIAAAAVYPKELRTTPTTKVMGVLEKARLRYRIVAETYENDNWFDGTPADLMAALRRAQEALVKDDLVEKTAKSLSMQLETVARLWIGQQSICDRLCGILGINAPKGEKKEKADERRETAARVSALVLANAYIFQEQLAFTDPRVDTLGKIEKTKDVIATTAKHWRWIWQNINYVPIFQLGERVLDELPASANTTIAVKALLAEARAICQQQAALRHDLMGRIYHWLLHEAKFLGTYYTSVSAATLLLKLALSLDWKQDFSNPRDLANFKIADLACGTGTLLMAAAQAVTDRYIRDRAAHDLSLTDQDISILHQTIMQNVLYGYDVLPTAVHLTASTLALLAPSVAFRNMNLYVMPMGLDHNVPRLGSLDFLEGPEVRTQFSLDDTQLDTVRTGAAKSAYTNAKVPTLHLCVMNPPFVRSVGGNLLFGSLPDERGQLQKELKSRVKKIGANATAGLGSVFVALADRRLEKLGRLAFVLPAALASGEAWAPTRRLIATRYQLEIVIASYDAERPNFSENTDLSEILFIARKRENGDVGPTTYVNLWRNPRSIHEALDLATRITEQKHPVQVTGAGFTSITSPSGKLGEIVQAPAPIDEENWSGALFAQTELFRIFWSLQKGHLRVPGRGNASKVPLCPLKQLGDLGYDRRDIHDAFEISYDDWSPYPAFWGHEAQRVQTIAQEPSGHLIARTTAAKGRKLKDSAAVWSKAGRLLLVERLRSNTHRVLAIGLGTKVVGNTWWALSTSLTLVQEKALLLWLNSTLALLLFFGRRVTTQGAWMQMKKPAWLSMPVLDVRILTNPQLKAFEHSYDKLAQEPLAPLAQLNVDSTRGAIDQVLAEILGLPDVEPIRALLAREPGLNAIDINPRASASDDDDDDDDEHEEIDF